MYYRISDQYALRGWQGIPYACYKKGASSVQILTKEEFDLLLLCDGSHDLPEGPLLTGLAGKEIIVPCREGEAPSAWSAYKAYENQYFPLMNLMITGKCNYNCLHCFNAVDNAPLQSQWEYDDLLTLLDQARDCGVHGFIITGGEPMVHPRFMDIMKAICQRGMVAAELNTNGFFITRELLREMKSFGCVPLMKISFDGLGYHDWMRNRKGAQERTLSAIALCREEGFPVMIQTQVNKKNADSMLSTAKLMDEMGVFQMRILRTTEVPRWVQNMPEGSLSMEDYYDQMLKLLEVYKDSGCRMTLDIWNFAKVYPKTRRFKAAPWAFGKHEFHFSLPVCNYCRKIICVTSSGEVVPCLQMQGYLEEKGIHMGNLHEQPLSEILSGGIWHDHVCSTFAQLFIKNEKCADCRYFSVCAGGCRAIGFLFAEEDFNYYAPDLTKCLYFENGWYEKTVKVFDGWKNDNPLRFS